MKQILLLFTGVLGLFFFIYIKLLSGSMSTTPITINQVATGGLPITASFVSPDLTNSNYPALMQEMKSTGIDTINVNISKTESITCGTSFSDTYLLDNPSSSWATLIKAALAANMKIIFGPVGQMTNDPCYNPLIGTPSDINTPMGHLIAHHINSFNKLKTFLSNNGVSWDDHRVYALYIPEEIPTYHYDQPDSPNIIYYKEVSARLATFGKKIMISPAQKEATDYNKSLIAFKNIIANTNINIIAPQDSMGYGWTTTFARSADHYKALADAKAAYPTKNVQVWANIELFDQPAYNTSYTPTYADNPPSIIPAKFSRVQQQIEAARPYVSKMTSWLYQQGMMTLPSSRDLYGTTHNAWQVHYTPATYTLRQALRSDYLAAYGAGLPSIAPSPSPTPSNVPADLNPTGDTPSDQVNIFDYNAFVGDYGKTGAPGFVPADMKKDGAVNIFDYNILVANFDK